MSENPLIPQNTPQGDPPRSEVHQSGGMDMEDRVAAIRSADRRQEREASMGERVERWTVGIASEPIPDERRRGMPGVRFDTELFGDHPPDFESVLVPASRLHRVEEALREANNTLEDFWPKANDDADADVMADVAKDLRAALAEQEGIANTTTGGSQ